MDKIIFSTKEVESLIRWRDEHKHLVRQMPAPFKAIELRFSDEPIVIKAIRDDQYLKLQVVIANQPQGHVVYALIDVMPNEKGLMLIKNKTKLNEYELQDCLTIYSSLMALIAYAQPEERSVVEETLTSKPNAVNVNKSKHLKKGVSITYLLSKANGAKRQMTAQERQRPNHAFSVRGHFRHYKSGKVVWIKQHVRCDGKKKSKTYKLGDGIDAESEVHE